MKNKSQMQLSADRIIKNQRTLFKLGQKLIKLSRSKSSTQKQIDELKQTIEIFIKLSGGVAYGGQTLASMYKTTIHDERLEIFEKSLILLKKDQPSDDLEKAWDKAHTTVIQERKN